LLFSAVEWPELKDLTLAGNHAIEDLLITSRRQAVRHIASNNVLFREILKSNLASAKSLIHISTDMWTSPHRSALLAVCTQWIGPDHKSQKGLLALPKCRYSHSGQKQAELILETLEAFNIMGQVRYHTSDNASSNDTCLAHLESLLWRKYAIKFDAKQCRICCIAHIINLSLQAFLLAYSKEALQAALEAAANVSSEELIAQFCDILNSQQQRFHNDADSS
jgi:hypothetical protein